MSKITAVRIVTKPNSVNGPTSKIYVTIDKIEKFLVAYPIDREVTFTTDEFIGLTLKEAQKHFYSKL